MKERWIEIADGINRVDPTKIKFIDEDHANLCSLVGHFNAVGNSNPISPEDLKSALKFDYHDYSGLTDE